MEIRAVARLAADEELARRQCQELVVELDRTIRRVLGMPELPESSGQLAFEGRRTRELLGPGR